MRKIGMYLEAARVAPKEVRLVSVIDGDGEQTLRLAEEAGAHLAAIPTPMPSTTVLEVKRAKLLGRLANFALYSVTNGVEFVAVDCNDRFGSNLHLSTTLSEAMAACRAHLRAISDALTEEA